MKSVLVTGGSGTFGTAFVRRLLTMPEIERIAIYSRGEHRQAEMAQQLAPLDPHEKLRLLIGDVRDKERLKQALRGVDVAVHAAALKRIEVGRYNPHELLKTNVVGTQNVIDACFYAGVPRAVLISSDKAFQPISPYGNSKAMAESLFLTANNMRGRDGTIFAACRYGNVWCSTGSVVPRWRSILAAGCRTVPVTDPECTRFFMRIDEAVDLVLETLRTMKGGEMTIPSLPAYRLGDLADAMGVTMDVRGLPAWEKAHESMAEGNSSDRARRMTMDELRSALEETA